MKLWPNQEQARANVLREFEAGVVRQLVKSPTGTGKTVFFSALIHEMRRRGLLKRALVIAHREELLDQAAEKIRAQNPGLSVAIEQGDRVASVYADVVIASIQTLQARNYHRLLRFKRGGPFELVIVDEAHHAAAPTYRTTLALLELLPPADMSEEGNWEVPDYDDLDVMRRALVSWTPPPGRLLLGVTATPNRGDAIGLECVFQKLVFDYQLKQAIRDGFLVDIEAWAVETKTSLDNVEVRRGDFVQSQLQTAVNNTARNEQIVAAWFEYARGEQTIAFTAGVQHAHDLADEFAAAGVKARAISGETPKDERRDTLQQFREGKLQILTNDSVLTEGTDLPMVSCILETKPTKSATLYEQMIGRGLRIYPPNKKRCVVIDFVDVARKHSLQNAPILYGLPPGAVARGKSLEKMSEEWNELAEKYGEDALRNFLSAGQHLTLEQLGYEASRVDVFGVPKLSENVRAAVELNWLRLSDNRYQLKYPWNHDTEIVEANRDMLGAWEVVTTIIPADRALPKRQRTLLTSIATEVEALRRAEEWIKTERQTIIKLKGSEAAWRTKQPSDGQLRYAKALKINIPAGITSGALSDMIDVAKAKGARARRW